MLCRSSNVWYCTKFICSTGESVAGDGLVIVAAAISNRWVSIISQLISAAPARGLCDGLMTSPDDITSTRPYAHLEDHFSAASPISEAKMVPKQIIVLLRNLRAEFASLAHADPWSENSSSLSVLFFPFCLPLQDARHLEPLLVRTPNVSNASSCLFVERDSLLYWWTLTVSRH